MPTWKLFSLDQPSLVQEICIVFHHFKIAIVQVCHFQKVSSVKIDEDSCIFYLFGLDLVTKMVARDLFYQFYHPWLYNAVQNLFLPREWAASGIKWWKLPKIMIITYNKPILKLLRSMGKYVSSYGEIFNLPSIFPLSLLILWFIWNGDLWRVGLLTWKNEAILSKMEIVTYWRHLKAKM